MVEETLSEIEQAIGCGLDLEFSTAASLARRIESGEPFDVAILTPALIAALVMEQAMPIAAGEVELVLTLISEIVSVPGLELVGPFPSELQGYVSFAAGQSAWLHQTRTKKRFSMIAPDSVATFARSGVGVGARAGGTADDIGTMEGAESVAFTSEGQSRRTIDAAFERLGIVETMQPSSVIVGPGEGPPAVAAGEVELVLTLISEIVSVPGLELVGPFPSELQGYVSFAAGISLATPSPQTGRALVRELSGPTVTAASSDTAWRPLRPSPTDGTTRTKKRSV